MNELFTYLFDENVLKNKLREKWIKLYDFNFVDKDIIGGLLTTKKNISDLLTFIYNKATASHLSVDEKEESAPFPETVGPSTTVGAKSKPEETKGGQKFEKELSKPKLNKKVTIPVPFNLSENKPRVLQEPMAISNQIKIKPLPLANYKKTSLKEIEEKRKEQLQIIKNNIIEKHKQIKGQQISKKSEMKLKTKFNQLYNSIINI